MQIYDFSEMSLGAAPVIMPPLPTASPKRVLRYAIQELQPLLAECHTGLPSHGTLTMNLALRGSPDLGVMVESVEVDLDDSASPVFEDSFIECMRETLYALELSEMTGVQRWVVHVPFVVKADAQVQTNAAASFDSGG
jgi:hypothetical protein